MFCSVHDNMLSVNLCPFTAPNMDAANMLLQFR